MLKSIFTPVRKEFRRFFSHVKMSKKMFLLFFKKGTLIIPGNRF
ncbi:hypothetical protein CHCC14821_3232 [Bacillus paralicheniformis]|nr:hypothetical protein CHCC14821_3232 [Bacillus paralicheniformis]TWM61723.1 hypothetical protein CHCC14814_2566 [Bacillus paralicheniformis]